jgi:2-keto-4-pentenoate hydratase/2-oxohepta-3-ene-1,7-dioic acid hydratase in catechol pathway
MLEGDQVRVCEDGMFAGAMPTDRVLPLANLQMLPSVQPGKIIAPWNSFHALGKKLGLAELAEPLYLIKANNSLPAPGTVIGKPKYEGKAVFKGGLGIVLGKTCMQVSEEHALYHVFGYTCANDFTLADICTAMHPSRSVRAPRDSTPSARLGQLSLPVFIQHG